ncbi:hypothetical protein SLS56_005202 [Neofusicoccum ribis]|uniref:Cyclin N-terminal domain-containing protein n=1 Tax=Neofusicoccum ribis TaxID=45134 RepID=A0ABR3SU87_9PEZI
MDAISLATTLADILRLPEECLGISFVYLNKYRKFRRQQDNLPDLNEHMLLLACLSLGAKATEAPRRVREFLLPAWRLMHMGKPATTPLICPSPTYDALRSAFVRTELILLRILRFELRVSTPFDFISGYMIGVMCDFDVGDSSLDAADEFDARSKEYKEGNRIVDFMETGIAKDCKTKAMAA